MHGNQRTNPVGGSSAAKLGNNVGSAVNKGENVSEPEAWEQSHGENVGERTHERTSLQVGEDRLRSGARPAQGTATTTDARTHERTSLQSGEKGDVLYRDVDEAQSVDSSDEEDKDVRYREAEDADDASKGRFIFEGELVSELDGTEFGDLSKDLKEEVARYFADEWGGSMKRPSFGDVILDKRSVKDDVSHGMNRQKVASFMAVPYIIRDGVVIDEQENWKGRNYDSVTIAAPITIGKERCIGIAIVKRQPGSNRFYLHTVMLQKSLQVGMLRTGTEAASRQGDIAKILNNLYHAVKKDKNQLSIFILRRILHFLFPLTLLYN